MLNLVFLLISFLAFSNHTNSGVLASSIDRYFYAVQPQSRNLQDELPSGYVKDGSVDYTSYVQEAIKKYSNITFPDFPILINDTGLKIGSNKKLVFLPGSELWLKASKKRSYNILRIDKSDDVTLINPVIKGDRYKHEGNSGEWGMGIGIYSSSNITITGAKVYDCWGDGIYLGRSGLNYPSNKNINITNAYLKNNRRDGISIIDVENLILKKIYAGYSNGTEPGCGINFEPNYSADNIKNAIVIDPFTEYNSGSGIQIGLNRLLDSGSNKVDISIINHIDIGSKKYAFNFSCYRRVNKNMIGNISGNINIINPVWKKSIVRPLNLWLTESNTLNVNIASPRIMNSKGAYLNIEEVSKLLKEGCKVGTYKAN